MNTIDQQQIKYFQKSVEGALVAGTTAAISITLLILAAGSPYMFLYGIGILVGLQTLVMWAKDIKPPVLFIALAVTLFLPATYILTKLCATLIAASGIGPAFF